MAGNDTKVEPSKESENAVNFSSPNVSTEWLINGSNITSGVVTMDSSMVEVSSVPSTITVGSFCPPPIWDQPINGQSFGYSCNMNVQNDPSTSSSLRADMGWIPNAMIRDGMFRPPVSRMLPHSSLPPFPSDSSFIERAARFSCFNGGGSFSAMVNPLGIPEPFGPVESEKKRELDEADGVNVSINQCDEGEFSGHGVQEELANTGEESTGKRHGLTKRKRVEQRGENKEGDGDTSMKKGDENPSSTSNHGGKQGKQDSQGSDPPKDDYIHVRARRGQATNSHSLAERIRREKISERMKLLQDLVPGCSKVTGKAVMLDEIINYVQSLQRQVEFLSMKLATVNPQLDFNMEGFLVKDIVQSRACLSSSNMAFPPDLAMPFPSLHTLHSGLNQAGLHGMRNPSGALQRSMELDSSDICGGLCEPSSQVKDHMQAPGVWDDELHNVVHNGFNSSGPLDHTPDASDHMKAEQ